jgi:SAM-dependent MidA family methyltransferase
VIRERSPVTFRWFMEQALYHAVDGFYSSGRCVIGRRGDYFTNVSVGSLFGRLMARQFGEIWERLGRPDGFVIVEQGAHDGTFASDVLAAARAATQEFFAALRYRIVEPFPVLRDRQRATLEPYRSKTEWMESLDALEPFTGVHFSNELIDALPVHLVSSSDSGWREKYVTLRGEDLGFVDGPISSAKLQKHLKKLPALPDNYETEVNLAALDWIAELSAKIERGIVLAVDYGFAREELYVSSRTSGTLRSVAKHRLVASSLVDLGNTDITAHVDWTSVCEKAEECGLTTAGFADQHHFMTALAAAFLPNELCPEDRTALQTLLHPGLLGRAYQFLALAKNFPPAPELAGFKFARNPRGALGLK